MSIFFVIPLSKGYHAVIDAADEDLAALKWTAAITSSTVYAYRSPMKNRKQTHIQLHVVILARKIGRELQHPEECDHKDGNGLNNSRDNLRLVSSSQNKQNRRTPSDNQSGVKGVYFCKTRQQWRAQISIDRKRISLGSFDCFDDAVASRHNKELELFGEFSVLSSREFVRHVMPQQPIAQRLTQDEFQALLNRAKEIDDARTAGRHE